MQISMKQKTVGTLCAVAVERTLCAALFCAVAASGLSTLGGTTGAQYGSAAMAGTAPGDLRAGWQGTPAASKDGIEMSEHAMESHHEGKNS